MQARAVRNSRSRLRGHPGVTLALSLVVAAALALMVYLSTTTLPYLASSPTVDPLLGRLNQCLISALREPRTGFALAADGSQGASYGGQTLARCSAAGPGRFEPLVLALGNISQAAFDLEGTLWLATPAAGEGAPKLWRLRRGSAALEPAGEAAAVALAGHAHGVVVLDASGRILALASDGQALAYAELPAPPIDGAQLASNADGTLIGLVAGDGLFVYRSADLSRVLAAAPCRAEFLWWCEDPARAVLSCEGGGKRTGLAVHLPDGQTEPVDLARPSRSAWVSGLRSYVRACDGLPCSAPAPWDGVRLNPARGQP